MGPALASFFLVIFIMLGFEVVSRKRKYDAMRYYYNIFMICYPIVSVFLFCIEVLDHFPAHCECVCVCVSVCACVCVC